MPSLFEESIDITGLRFYTLKQEDGKYLSFAYNEHKIIDAIKSAGITFNQVLSIHFAQIEFEELVKGKAQTCLKVNNVCLSFIEEKLVQIPVSLRANIDNSFDISNLKLSKEKIYLDSTSKYLDKKHTYTLVGVLLLVTIFTFIKAYSNYSEAFKYSDKKERLITTNNMPSTSIQTNALIKKYKKIKEKQINIRETIEYVLNSRKKIGARVVGFDFNKEKLVVKFKGVEAKKITTYLEKEYTLNKAVVKDGITSVELSL